MKKNNKGFTISELIITFAIVMTISLGLFKIVDSYKEKQQTESYKKELSAYRDEVLRVIEDDMSLNKVKNIIRLDTAAGTECQGYNQGVQIQFYNGTNKNLCYGNKVNVGSKSKAGIKYGDKFYEVPSKFIKFEDGIMINDSDKNISTNTIVGQLDGNNYVAYKLAKTIYKISITMKHEELKEKTQLILTKSIATGSQQDTTCNISWSATIILTTEMYNRCGAGAFKAFKDAGKTVNVIVNGSTELLRYINNIDKIDKLTIGDTVKAEVGAFNNATINNLNVSNASSLLAQSNLDRVAKNSTIKTLEIKGEGIWNNSGNLIKGTNVVNNLYFSDYKVGLRDVSTTPNASAQEILDKVDSINFSDITTIGKDAFNGLKFKTKTTISLKNGVDIGEKAFLNTENIKKLTIPQNITVPVSATSSWYVFTGANIEEVVIENANAIKKTRTSTMSGKLKFGNVGKLTINSGVLEDYLFYQQPIGSVAFGAGVTSIGANAFNGCGITGDITIPSNIMSIGNNGVFNGNNFSKLTIEKCSTSVCQSSSSTSVSTFGNSFETLIINEGVIGDYAFTNATGLKNLTLGDGVTKIGFYSFRGTTNLTDVEFNKVTEIGNYSFYNSKIKSLTIPSSLTSIGSDAFYNNRIAVLEIPATVTYIGSKAFEKNPITNLHIIKCSDGISEVDRPANALRFGSDLETVIIDSGEIGTLAFANQKKLTSVTLGNGITAVKYNAFTGCTALNKITVKMAQANWNNNVTLGGGWKPSSTTLSFEP